MPVTALETALALVQMIPTALAAAAQLRESLSETDQATLDAEIDRIKADALAAGDQAIADLDAASKT